MEIKGISHRVTPHSMQKPLNKYWSCFCHKCGKDFPSTDAIAIVCASCTSGQPADNPMSAFAEAFKDIFTKQAPAK